MHFSPDYGDPARPPRSPDRAAFARAGGGITVIPGYCTSIPLTSELSFTEVNLITYCPLELALAVNCSITALFLAPAVAKMSKLVSTCVPLMVTLNIRDPAVDQ